MCLSGHNIRAVVALCRWAARRGVPLHLAARDAEDPIWQTDHAAQVFVQRSSPALSLQELLGWIRTLRARHDHDRVVIAPSTEFFNRFLLRHRAPIEAAGGVIPLVDEALYARISDKEAFAAMCRDHGIAVPAEYPSLPNHLPFVAKPRRYLGADGQQLKPQLVLTDADRAAFEQAHAPADFFYQEFVDGQSLYLLAHIARNGEVTATAQENLMQQPRGGSIVVARGHDFHTEPDARPYVDMLVSAGFHGLVMIEVRRCVRSGRAVMIEANPRMWGPLQFMLDRNVDPFTPLLRDHGMTLPLPQTQEPALPYYFWAGGLSQQPCAFHNFSADDFVASYPAIAACDLFLRDDSRRLHRHELANA